MKTSKKLAIYLDHLVANLIELTNTAVQFKIIESNFHHQEKEAVLQRGESHMHNKEQHLQNKYYEKLSDEILNFDQVMLFGPTSAKTELYNSISSDNRFSKIQIRVENSDKLTPNQQIAFANISFTDL